MVIKNFLDRFFPPKYNFYEMLSKQAELTFQGVSVLSDWLVEQEEEKSDHLLYLTDKADEIRLDMEAKLIEAFTTPFDRQDLYYLSVQMDRIIEHAKSTFLAIEDYEVKPDEIIIEMVKALERGMIFFAESIKILENNPINAKEKIKDMRKAQNQIDELYFKGMTDLFKKNDTMYALKYREVYNHLKDAGLNFGFTVDSFHRIVVRVV